MASDFLNRRMDLLHEVDTNTNLLKMDSSYPVNIAGKVIKLFTATADYSTDIQSYTLVNSNGTIILSVADNKVYDFAGRIIKNNIGEDQIYATPVDVYRNGDYVMAIIDFDAQSIFLCSQTNFTGFIGGSEGSVKIYDIDGDDSPSRHDSGIEFDYDKEIFDEASSFEAMEGHNAFTKFEEEQVLYENPKTQEVGEDTYNRSMIPIAKAEVININSGLSARLNKFMFMYIDNLAGDNGTSYPNKIAAFTQLFGTMNADFINTYCLSETEMLNSNLIQSCPMEISKSILEIYYNIPDIDKPRYKYIFTAMVDKDNFVLHQYDKTMKFIPFDVESGTFPLLFKLNNRGLVVNNESVEFPTWLHRYGDYIGQLRPNDDRQGFSVYHYRSRFEFLLPEYNDSDSVSSDLNESLIVINDLPKIYKAPGDSFASESGITHSNDYSYTDFSTYLTPITKVIDFFVEPQKDAYKQNLYRHAIAFQNSTNDEPHYNLIGDTPILPNTVVIEYPNLNGVGTPGVDITNYTMDLDEITFDRTKFMYVNRVSPNDNASNISLVYKLFNTTITEGYMDSDKAGLEKGAYMRYYDDYYQPEGYLEVFMNYKFKSTRSLSAIENGQNNTGIYMNDERTLVFAPISVISVNKIAPDQIGQELLGSLTFNPAEVTASNFVVVKKIKMATDYIHQDLDSNLYIVGENGRHYDLFVVIKLEEGQTIPEGVQHTDLVINSSTYSMIRASVDTQSDLPNFKSPYTNWKGEYLYMYYRDDYTNVHRIKYHYRKTSGSSSRDIESYDYFTDNIVIDWNSIDMQVWWEVAPWSPVAYHVDVLNRINNKACYLRAYINALSVNYKRDTVNTVMSFNGQTWQSEVKNSFKPIIYVDAIYNLYLSANANPSSSELNGEIIRHKSNLLNASSNHNLTVGVDEIIVYPGTNNNKNIYDINGIRMSDMFKDKEVVIEENSMTPIVSNKLDINGGYVYNIPSYLSIIQSTSINAIGEWNNYYSVASRINIDGISRNARSMKIFDFFKYALSHDLSSAKTVDEACFDTVETANIAFIKRSRLVGENAVKIMTHIMNETSYYIDVGWAFMNSNNQLTPITSGASTGGDGLVLHTNLDPKNISDISKATMNDSSGIDRSSAYVDTGINTLINTVTTGNRKVYGISLNDSSDSLNPNIAAFDGTEDTIVVSDINTNTLLNAISGNKSIDILTYSLKTIRYTLNNNIINPIQNISDTITMQENYVTVQTANRTDDPYPGNANFDPYRKPVGSTWGIFNEEIGVYDFSFGYGYISESGYSSFDMYRTLNNRGVIVFVTEDGNSYRQAGSGGDVTKYSNKLPDIHPKRMYVSKDGLVCTKEYFDAEEAIYATGQNYPNEYPDATTLADVSSYLESKKNDIDDISSIKSFIEQYSTDIQDISTIKGILEDFERRISALETEVFPTNNDEP